jgi:pterin-4a-carbinolamine dehydratase
MKSNIDILHPLNTWKVLSNGSNTLTVEVEVTNYEEAYNLLYYNE